MAVHPTAIIHQDAKIHPTADIGPYAIIKENVEIGANCKIDAHAWISHTVMGEGTTVASHAHIGGDPQTLNWKEVPSLVRMGKNNIVRELVVIGRSMVENGETLIGDDCFFLANAHVGHDSIIGNNVILTTMAGLSGHVTVEDGAVIGGLAGVHQFVRIGELAMVGGMARIVQDVAPFMLAEGTPAEIRKTNVVGLRRKGYGEPARANIKEAFKILFKSGLSLKTAREKLAEIEDKQGEIAKILNFVNSTKRGLTGV
ncbi:MAG: acyl-ACP--UDP-N-acetylglucosamine O-acyltransferase [Nitrospinae bacterium]|nr:acyl-ACP--UDP-N-acetylglucosamine O-acyltransferase [Nitrospinota bacterium]